MTVAANNKKRKEDRTPLTASIFFSPVFEAYKDVRFWGITVDVSPSGLSFYTNQLLEEGTCIKIHSKLLWDNVRNARIIWCKEINKDLYRLGLSLN